MSDLRYQALEAWQKDTCNPTTGAVSTLCWEHKLLSPDEALEHVERRTKTEALLCALYLLDEAGVSLPKQRAICAVIYADLGLQECEQVLREREDDCERPWWLTGEMGCCGECWAAQELRPKHHACARLTAHSALEPGCWYEIAQAQPYEAGERGWELLGDQPRSDRPGAPVD